MLNLASVIPQIEEMAAQASDEQRLAELAEFQAKYGLTFTRETFTQEQPNADGAFVLTPNNDDPLPPIGCRVKVYGYHGEMWQTVVVDTDESAGTYTAQVSPEARSRFGDHTDGLYDDQREGAPEPAV